MHICNHYLSMYFEAHKNTEPVIYWRYHLILEDLQNNILNVHKI